MIMSSARYLLSLGKTYQDNLVSYNRLINLICAYVSDEIFFFFLCCQKFKRWYNL